MRRIGFTLIELLVVASIIVLLAALLLPAISMVRAAGIKAKCASNQRQLAMAILAYSDVNNDRMPLCYVAGSPKQGSYYMRKSNEWAGGFGLLYVTGILDDKSAYYCPAVDEAAFNEDGSDNAWPPGTGSKTRCSYSLRPAAGWDFDGPIVEQLSLRTDYGAMDAMSSCLCAQEIYVEEGHRTGLNVSYGDGHIGWVPREAVKDTLSQLDGQGSSYDAIFDQLWVDFGTYAASR